MTKFVTFDDMKKLRLELGEMIKAAFLHPPQAARKPVRVVINICGNATTEVVSSEENAGAEEDGPPGDDDPDGNEDPSVPAAVLAAVPAAVLAAVPAAVPAAAPAAATAARGIDFERLEHHFKLSFKRSGGFDILKSRLMDHQSAKSYAKIAYKIYTNRAKLLADTYNTFSLWYKTFCDIVGIEPKTYKPNKLAPTPAEEASFFFLN